MTDMNEEKDRQDLEKETEPLPAEKPEEAPAPEKEEKKNEKKDSAAAARRKRTAFTATSGPTPCRSSCRCTTI